MKKFAYPLQAFAALFICGGMAWMVFVLAGLNPTPPTVMDLQARNTQDLSFANMNSTAVALAKEMVVNLIPTSSGPFLLPVTGNGTPTPVPPAAVTLVAIARSGQAPTPFSLFSFLFQPTATKEKPIKDGPALIPTLLPTHTLAPTSTATRSPTQTQPPSPTSLPPTLTPTDVPPTASDTSIPPTDTPEPTLPPTDTSEPPTSTPRPSGPPTSRPPTATNPPPTDTPEPVIPTSEPDTPLP